MICRLRDLWVVAEERERKVRDWVWVATEGRAKRVRFADCCCVERDYKVEELDGWGGHLCVAAEEKRQVVMDLWVAAE